MRYFPVVLAVLTLFAPLCSVFAKDTEVLHYTIHYPPYFEGSYGNYTGSYVKVLDAIYSRAELNVKMETVPYARIHKFMLPKNVAIVVYGANPETDHKLLYPVPKTSIILKVVGLSTEPPTELKELEGKRIAIKRGYPLGRFEKIRSNAAFHTVSTNTVAQALQLLLLNRVDYIVTLDGPLQKEVKRLALDKTQIIDETIESLSGWPIAVVKSHPRADELHRSIKTAYEELIDEGVIKYDNQQMFIANEYRGY